MRDLLILVWAIILGILFSFSRTPLAVGLCLTLAAILILPLVYTKKRSVWVLIAGLVLGAGVSSYYRSLTLPAGARSLRCTFSRRSGLSDLYLFKGRIIEIKEYAGESRFDPPGKTLLHGQTVDLVGIFKKTPFALTGTLYEGRDVTWAIPPGPMRFSARVDRWKKGLAEKLTAGLGDEAGALASSLVLGTADPVLKERADILRYLGIIHILSISGFHVNLLEMLLRRIRLKSISLPVILGYAFLISSVPAWRAALMKLSKESGRLLCRDSDGVNQLLTAMAMLLLGRPYLLFDVSFQLTCAAALGLTALNRPLADVFYKVPPSPLKDALLLSLSAMIPCLPFLSAMNFDANLALLAANFLIVPLYSFYCVLAFISLPAAVWDLEGLFFILSWAMQITLRLIGLLEFIMARFLSFRVSYDGFMLCLWLTLVYVYMRQHKISVRRQVWAMVLCYGLMFNLTFLPGTTRVGFYKERGQARVLVRHNLRQYELVSEDMYRTAVRRSAVPVGQTVAAGDVVLMPQAGDFPRVLFQGVTLSPMSGRSSDIIEEEYLLIFGNGIRLK